jgi:hypothetical protein
MRIGKRKGSATVEFGLAGSFIFLPMLAGLASVGMSMVMAIQVVGLNRDAGRLFAGGVDFSEASSSQSATSSRGLLLKLAGGLNITDTGGNGVIILSEFDGTGPNTAVCSRRIVVGNASLKASSYANPSAAVLDEDGSVTNLSDPSAAVNASFMTLLPMTQGQVAYLVETYFSTSQYDWTGLLNGTGIYAKAIF